MKVIKLADGFDSSTTPTSELIDTSNMVSYADDAAYEAVYGAGISGSTYLNTTDKLIHYHNGTAWTTQNDHDTLLNNGTVSHADLDTHYADSDIHFEMLDEDDFASDSNTKTVTQQSAKTYIDGATAGFLYIEYNASITAGSAVKIIDSSGAKADNVANPPVNFAGIAQSTGTSGNGYYIALTGNVSTVHSGGVAGSIAYIQTDGTISTTATSYPAGRYLSATEILVTPNP